MKQDGKMNMYGIIGLIVLAGLMAVISLTISSCKPQPVQCNDTSKPNITEMELYEIIFQNTTNATFTFKAIDDCSDYLNYFVKVDEVVMTEGVVLNDTYETFTLILQDKQPSYDMVLTINDTSGKSKDYIGTFKLAHTDELNSWYYGIT